MGDFRALINLKMEMHGKVYEHEMWINWTPNDDGCDQRVIDCFASWWQDAYYRYEEREYEARREEREKREREAELAELKRLKEKYEP